SIAASNLQCGRRQIEMRQFTVRNPRRFGRALALSVGLVSILTMKAGIAQEKPAIPLSVPDDWTHHHVIFSAPRSQAAANRLANDPRYWHQWLQHNRQLLQGEQAPESPERYAVPGLTAMYQSALAAAGNSRKPQPPQQTDEGITQDWSTSLR